MLGTRSRARGPTPHISTRGVSAAARAAAVALPTANPVVTFATNEPVSAPAQAADMAELAKATRGLPMFNGTTTEDLDNWVWMVDQALTVYAENLDGRRRVTFVATKLGGTALTWWRSIYASGEAETILSSEYPLAAFFAAIRRAFIHGDPEQEARDKLGKLTQRSSVSQFADKIRETCVAIPGITDREKLDVFLRGVRADIGKHVRTNLNIHGEKTYELAVSVALAAESGDRAAAHAAGTVGTAHPKHRHRDSAGTSTGAAGSTQKKPYSKPYEHNKTSGVNAKKPGGERQNRLAPQDLARLKREGRCFRCRQHGHLSRNCPSKPGTLNSLVTQLNALLVAQNGKQA
jgi:hypothetical protein